MQLMSVETVQLFTSEITLKKKNENLLNIENFALVTQIDVILYV